jgi:DNA-directed RNA polymerase specialized sigma subunit
MEDDLKKNGRQPQKRKKKGRQLKKNEKERRPQKNRKKTSNKINNKLKHNLKKSQHGCVRWALREHLIHHAVISPRAGWRIVNK